MKTAVVYYTGTGGTRLVASELKKAFDAIGSDCEIHQIHTKNDFSIKDQSHVAIAYPVHAGRSPLAVEEWASEQDFTGMDVSLLPVSGGADIIPNTASRIPMKKIIKKNGGNIVYEDMFVMPANVFLQTPPKTKQALINILPKKAGEIAEDIKNGVSRKAKVIFTDRLMEVIGALEHMGAKQFGRQLLVDESCNLCGKCVRNCPTGNIRIEEEKVVYDDKCGLCMGCVYICPQKSIHAKFMNFYILKDGMSYPEKSEMPLYKDCSKELRSILWIGVRRYLRNNM
jgi:ferredoxin